MLFLWLKIWSYRVQCLTMSSHSSLIRLCNKLEHEWRIVSIYGIKWTLKSVKNLDWQIESFSVFSKRELHFTTLNYKGELHFTTLNYTLYYLLYVKLFKCIFYILYFNFCYTLHLKVSFTSIILDENWKHITCTLFLHSLKTKIPSPQSIKNKSSLTCCISSSLISKICCST